MRCASAEPLLIMTQYQEQTAAVFLIFHAAHAAGSTERIPITAAVLKERQMNIAVMNGWDMGNPEKYKSPNSNRDIEDKLSIEIKVVVDAARQVGR